jgi:hypothetical protein
MSEVEIWPVTNYSGRSRGRARNFVGKFQWSEYDIPRPERVPEKESFAAKN